MMQDPKPCCRWTIQRAIERGIKTLSLKHFPARARRLCGGRPRLPVGHGLPFERPIEV